MQFLPDVDVPCPECNGSRYAKEAWEIGYENKQGNRYSLPELMEMDVNTALQATADLKVVHQRLEVLKNLGLGYLTLGEETPSLSGGEAQRLKLASEMGKGQSDSVFVFDEPTIGRIRWMCRRRLACLMRWLTMGRRCWSLSTISM